jgi:hypothetical protein
MRIPIAKLLLVTGITVIVAGSAAAQASPTRSIRKPLKVTTLAAWDFYDGRELCSP